MNTEQKNELKLLLSQLDARGRKQLVRDASALRTGAQSQSAKEANRPVEWFMLHLLQKRQGNRPAGIVLGVDRTQCCVRIDGADQSFHPLPGIAPGDEVEVSSGRLVEVRPRRTTLYRKESGGPRLIAANLDLIVVVVSVVAPPLHPRLIDRYLAAIRLGGADAAICLNKSDLGVSQEDEEAIAVYRDLVPVFRTSSATGEGVSAMREFMGSRLTALVGHSGVGKSSVLNALLGGPVAAAGTVSEDTGKGRHTTTRSTLHERHGMRILDTPGIREFAVNFESPQDVELGFSEIARHSAACRYRNCMHAGAEGCAVTEALRAGSIRLERYDSYLKLLRESFPGALA